MCLSIVNHQVQLLISGTHVFITKFSTVFEVLVGVLPNTSNSLLELHGARHVFLV